MGPGHFGVALAVKPLAPKAPLWTLLVAGEALDLLYFGFLAVGIEKGATTQVDLAQGIKILTPGNVPWSHGLLMSLVWSLVVAGIAYLLLRDRRTSGLLGFVVFSHWVLDFIVHEPDLPLLFGGSPVVGLGLWGSGPGLILSAVLDNLIFVAGLVIYLRWRGTFTRKTALPKASKA